MVRRKNNDGSRSVHLDPRASHKGGFVDLELARGSKAANSDSGRLPRGNQKRAIMRAGLRGRLRPEVKNSAINTYPAAVLQQVFVFIDSAIVDGQTDILKPLPVLRVIFKQAQQ